MLVAHVAPKKSFMVDHGVTQLVKDIDRPARVAPQGEVRRLRTNVKLFENSLVGNTLSKGSLNVLCTVWRNRFGYLELDMKQN